MIRAANVLRLAVKELRSIKHDKVLLVFLIWAFTGGIYTAATAASRELHNAPVAVVDEDRSPLSQRLIDALYPPYFKPPEHIAMEEMNAALDAGRYTFVIVIPSGFQRDVLAGRRPDIQVNIDATRMTQAFIGNTYIQNILTTEMNAFLAGYRAETSLPVELQVRAKYNPNLNGVWFGGVMEIISNVTMLSIILTGAALIREREHGTIEHLLVMPLRPAEIMLSKILAAGLVVLVAAGLSLWLVVERLLQVPVAGSVPLFLIGAALHLFATTSLGILLGTVARSMPQLGLLIILVILPLQLLSGGITPRESMPQAVQDIMLAAPTTHFVRLAQGILYRGAGIEVVWPQMLALIAIGAVCFLIALSLFRHSLTAR